MLARTAPETSNRRSASRKRVAAAAMALGVSSLVAVGGLSSPADAQARTAVSHCTGGPDAPTLGFSISDFPPNESFPWFGYVNKPDGTSTVYNFGPSLPVTTDATGAGSVGSVTFPGLPLSSGLVVYRDTNGSQRLDSGDERLYEGNVTITDCPADVTFAPK